MTTILLALVLGAVIGLSLGMLGGGGSILTVPALVYLLGQNPHAAVSASLVIVGLNAATGAWLHQRAGNVRLRAALLFGGAGLLAAFAGARLSTLLTGPLLSVEPGAVRRGAAVGGGGPRCVLRLGLPFGTLQEWLYAASTWLQRHIRPLGRGVKALKAWAGTQPVRRFDQRGAPTLIQRIDHWLRALKYIVLAWILPGTAGYGYLVFRDYDPWAALISITELELTGGLIVLAVMLVAALFVERPWCRYACPLGAVIGIASKVSPLHIQRNGPACAGCALCNTACPVGIPVDTRTDITDASCIMCLRCVDACPKHGELDLTLTIPGLKAQPTANEPSEGAAS